MTNPTTPTPEQLRLDAARLREAADDCQPVLDDNITPDGDELDADQVASITALRDASRRAALVLEEQAARLEAPVVVGNAIEALDALHRQAQDADGSVGALVTMSSYYAIVASALTRLTTEGATAQEALPEPPTLSTHSPTAEASPPTP